jgi:hypothetical protein
VGATITQEEGVSHRAQKQQHDRHTDGGLVLVGEALVDILVHERGLADAGGDKLDKSEWGPNMVHGARETRKHVGSSRRSTSGGDSRVDRGEGQGQHLKRGGVRRPDSEQRCSPRVAEDDDLSR